MPLVADIHFDYRLALAALDAGIHAIRLNPGNIGARERVREVVKAARERKVPIRIGVNAGSLEEDIVEKHGWPTAEGMVESAERHIRFLEDEGYREIKVSLKAHDVGHDGGRPTGSSRSASTTRCTSASPRRARCWPAP